MKPVNHKMFSHLMFPMTLELSCMCPGQDMGNYLRSAHQPARVAELRCEPRVRTPHLRLSSHSGWRRNPGSPSTNSHFQMRNRGQRGREASARSHRVWKARTQPPVSHSRGGFVLYRADEKGSLTGRTCHLCPYSISNLPQLTSFLSC